MKFRNAGTWMRFGVLLLSGAALTSLTWAEGPKITGFIDTTYNYNFNKPKSQTTKLGTPKTGTAGSNLSYYNTRANSFLLNTAHLAFTGSLDNGIGYVVEVDAGSDAQANTSVDANGGNAADDFDIQEAYFTYKCPMTGLNLKAGKFVTLEGIEVAESPANFNISRGHLFGMAEPVTHVGLLFARELPVKGLEARAGVVNGWDQLTDVNKGKTIIGGLGINYGDTATGALSFSYGPEQVPAAGINVNGRNRTSVDLTVFNKSVKDLTLGLQGNWGQEDFGPVTGFDRWSGLGIQAFHQCKEKFGVGARYEYMDNKKGTRFGNTGGSASNITITPTHKCTDNITFRVEYRYDWANKQFFETESGVFDSKHANQVFTEFIYSF